MKSWKGKLHCETIKPVSDKFIETEITTEPTTKRSNTLTPKDGVKKIDQHESMQHLEENYEPISTDSESDKNKEHTLKIKIKSSKKKLEVMKKENEILWNLYFTKYTSDFFNKK